MVASDPSAEKQCPFCAETIKAAAIRCRYCQSDLPGNGGSTPAGTLEPDPQHEPEPGHDPDHDPPAPVPEAGPAQDSVLASGRLLVLLVALCLVLAGVTGYAWWSAEHPDASETEGPITSSQARDAGLQEATELTAKVLSYDWKTLAADMSDVEKVLAPSFRSEYTKTMDKVRTQTVRNQVKLVASPVATSIVSATDTKVVALVFVNQVTTAKGSKNQRLDQNRVLVTLTRGGGEWRVSKMKAF